MEILNLKNSILQKNKSEGFTLIELLIAVTILSLTIILVGQFLINVTRVYWGSNSARSGQQNVRVAMETISRYVRQARKATWTDTNGDLVKDTLNLTVKDESAVDYNISFARRARQHPNNPSVFINVIEMSMNPGGIVNQPLTSKDVNIRTFDITYSPGVPVILNITIAADIENYQDTLLEKGASGQSRIQMTTAAALKGQYY